MKFPLQYSSEKSTIKVGNETVEVKAYQIVLWMSISSPVSSSLGTKVPKLPAILDTGTTHNFFLTQDHLQRGGQVFRSAVSSRRVAFDFREQKHRFSTPLCGCAARSITTSSPLTTE